MDMVGDGVLELSESLMGHGQGPERAQKIKADLGLPIFCRHARPTIKATELATLTKLTNKSIDVLSAFRENWLGLSARPGRAVSELFNCFHAKTRGTGSKSHRFKELLLL
jgi:hypothetical protein